ncbi:DUF2069 domain-containing protein [Thalassotalea ponticola]|uniref:DUF2069 domain-containing protein n=1 Tax=Thalassotalea ponticola TaxID=1523392 RepID=UPI0025B45AFC|nr:DUF2069 domain-containing protein [Thalassotalea ponticola]MDN3653026.1 DUF2069 domain-containing protein [Thalassotalea ponticola]
MSKQRFSTSTLRKMATFGYLGLLVYMPLWLLLLSPSEALSPTLAFVMFVVPLLLPIKGILQGNPYTFAWANFIVLIYFLHSLTTLWVAPEETWFALIELALASLMFFAGAYYSKYRGQELGLKIRKLKEDLKDERDAFEKNENSDK